MTSSDSADRPVPEGRRTRATIIEHQDASGTYWTLRDKGNSDVEVFWSEVENAACICIRQETPGAPHVDLITLTDGQAYDLLTALSAALDLPYQAPKIRRRRGPPETTSA
jgi:hypothetical protein